MNNKTIGNGFEQELCERLFKSGFWAHLLNANKAGQPADIIAVRNKKPYLIDAKVCSRGKFPLRRIEENQDLAMNLWRECGNGVGWFALKLDEDSSAIYMISHYMMQAYMDRQYSLSAQEIVTLGEPIEKWVEKCK